MPLTCQVRGAAWRANTLRLKLRRRHCALRRFMVFKAGLRSMVAGAPSYIGRRSRREIGDAHGTGAGELMKIGRGVSKLGWGALAAAGLVTAALANGIG